MAFDAENHEVDPRSGFMVSKDTGHPIGLVPPPLHSPQSIEWPKWVVVHGSHIDRKETEGGPVHISVPAYPDYHVNRANGEVTVLVHNEDEEKAATAEAVKKDDDQKQLPGLDEQIRREVHRDIENTERDQSRAASAEILAARAVIEADETRRRMAEQAGQREQNQKTAAEIAAADQTALDTQLGDPVTAERRRILAEEAARHKPPVA
jgi:hypothetical protein